MTETIISFDGTKQIGDMVVAELKRHYKIDASYNRFRRHMGPSKGSAVVIYCDRKETGNCSTL